MSAETDLRTLLLATTAVTALVGTRVAADRIEQGSTRPFVVFSRTGTTPYETIDKQLLASQVALDVQCWADTRAQADAVANAVAAAVRGTPTQMVLQRSSAYDSELDLEATMLSVEWWE